MTVVDAAAVPAVIDVVAVLCPAATVSVAGTGNSEIEPLDNWTAAPPSGAEALREAVTVAVDPPATLAGAMLKEESVTAVVTVTATVCGVRLPYVPVIVTAVAALTDPAVTDVLTLVQPAGIVIVAGTGRAVELVLARLIVTPPVGARLLRVAVKTVAVPDGIDDGEREREKDVGDPVMNARNEEPVGAEKPGVRRM